MSEQMNEQTLQDQHLDMMIRLAFFKDEEEAIQQLLDEPDPTLTPQEEIMANQAFLNAMRVSEAKNRRERITLFTSKTKKIFPRIIQVAASIVLIIGIATPIAIAASSEFRSRVMQLLLEIDSENNEAHFSFQENNSATFYVPDSWKGKYYPSYIPENFEIEYTNSFGDRIRMTTVDNQMISFAEFDENVGLTVGIENASMSTIYLNNNTVAYLTDGYAFDIHGVSIVWAVDDKWFDLATNNIDTSEAIRIAESVKKIILEN